MKRIEEQAQLLDLEYQGIALLFDQFCQRAGTLAKQYKFFNWPDYEDTPPLCRAFTLLGRRASSDSLASQVSGENSTASSRSSMKPGRFRPARCIGPMAVCRRKRAGFSIIRPNCYSN